MLETISIIIFFSIVGILMLRDRKNIEFRYGIVIRRWKKGLEAIDGFASRHKTLLRNVGNAAVVIGIVTGIAGTAILVFMSFKAQQAFSLVLPTAAGYKYPGPVVSVPFWYWLIGIFILIVIHESMHAVFARLEKIPIKNYGIMLLLFLPIGAFVDPNMERIKKLSLVKKLRIYVAGSFANLLMALLVLAIGFLISNFLFTATGVGFTGTVGNSPANTSYLSGTITEMNSIPIKSVQDLSLFLNKTKVGDEINIKTTAGEYQITTVARPDNQTGSFIGISSAYTYFKTLPFLSPLQSGLLSFSKLLFWLFVLNLGVGIANLLPMKPFDGGLIFEEIFLKIFKKKGKYVARAVTFILIFLLVFNLFIVRLFR